MSKINLSRRGLFGLFAGAAAVAVAPKVTALAEAAPNVAAIFQRPGALATPNSTVWFASRVYEVGDSIFHGTGEGAVTWVCVNPEGFEPLEALDWVGAA